MILSTNDLQKEKHSANKFLTIWIEPAQQYYLLTSEKLPSIGKELELSDFYHPSESQKNAEIAFIILTIAGITYIIWKFV